MAILLIDSVYALVCEQQHWRLPFIRPCWGSITYHHFWPA